MTRTNRFRKMKISLPKSSSRTSFRNIILKSKQRGSQKASGSKPIRDVFSDYEKKIWADYGGKGLIKIISLFWTHRDSSPNTSHLDENAVPLICPIRRRAVCIFGLTGTKRLDPRLFWGPEKTWPPDPSAGRLPAGRCTPSGNPSPSELGSQTVLPSPVLLDAPVPPPSQVPPTRPPVRRRRWPAA